MYMVGRSVRRNKLPRWIILFLVIAIVFLALQIWRAKEKTEEKYMIDSVMYHETDLLGKGMIANVMPTHDLDQSKDMCMPKLFARITQVIVPCFAYAEIYGRDEVVLYEQDVPCVYMENGGVDESSNETVEEIDVNGQVVSNGVNQVGAITSQDSKKDANQVGATTSQDSKKDANQVGTTTSQDSKNDANQVGATTSQDSGQVRKSKAILSSKDKVGSRASLTKRFKPSPNHTYSGIYTDQQLASFSFLKSTLYSLDAITPVKEKDLNVKKLMGINLSLEESKKEKSKKKQVGKVLPLVLIYHTHTSEAFADSRKGHVEDTVVGVGDVLTRELEQKGISVLHDTTVYDVIDGKLDRSAAYNVAGESVKKLLEQNPSIQVVIDLHRDGVAEETRLVTTIDDKKMAQIMLFNGMSRIKGKGEIPYLANSHRTGNLAFSLQIQLKGLDQYDGLMRKIFLRSYRYNLHFRDRSLLVEAGAQTNKVQEVKNSMVPLGDLISQVLLGE